MDTGGPMAIPTDLTLHHWLSSSFPVGSFAYSHGLEAAGLGARDLQPWLSDALHHGAGRGDAILIHVARRVPDPSEVDMMARALAPSAERLLETDQQGSAFVKTFNAVWGQDLPPLTYPVALGAAARMCEIPALPLVSLYLQTFVSNLTQAAIRLSLVAPTEAHRIVHALNPHCAKLAHDTAEAELDDIASSAFLIDIASMRHETQQPRIFRS